MDWQMHPVMEDQCEFYEREMTKRFSTLEALVTKHDLFERFGTERYELPPPEKLRRARTHGMAAGCLQLLHGCVLLAEEDAGKGKGDLPPLEAFIHPDLLREMIRG